jgi:hypothetical protein
MVSSDPAPPHARCGAVAAPLRRVIAAHPPWVLFGPAGRRAGVRAHFRVLGRRARRWSCCHGVGAAPLAQSLPLKAPAIAGALYMSDRVGAGRGSRRARSRDVRRAPQPLLCVEASSTVVARRARRPTTRTWSCAGCGEDSRRGADPRRRGRGSWVIQQRMDFPSLMRQRFESVLESLTRAQFDPRVVDAFTTS